ncbi:hypothetical protein LCGC14_0890790 [marine sediment metagenome]|uniref:Uncharacterized protein n=1 Tax=marine sediment metagenome TaxID=412755 RepID=A0A0F9P461_9ZZZZ
MNMLLGKKLVAKIQAGDSLTNPELKHAITFYGELANMLWVLGPEFKLAWKEVHSTLGALERFQEARDRG